MRKNLVILLILLLATLLLASCNDNKKASVAEIVSQWEGREIIFPDNSVFTIQGRYTVDFQFLDAPYKILTYVDSVGCMSCKLHLPIWNHYIYQMDSIAKGKVKFVFYMHSNDKEELSFIMQRDQFYYPTCFDELDMLNQLNNFPTCIMYHTFLLDRNNKVLAVGNPVLDLIVRDRFYEILNNGKKTNRDSKTSVCIDSGTINLGINNRGQKEHVFILTNTGENDLYIKEVLPSCDCMEVSFDDSPISQGKSTFIRVFIDLNEKGDLYNMVSVYANIDNSPLELHITELME